MRLPCGVLVLPRYSGGAAIFIFFHAAVESMLNVQGAAFDMSVLVGLDVEVFPFEGENFTKPCARDVFGEHQPSPEVERRFRVFDKRFPVFGTGFVEFLFGCLWRQFQICRGAESYQPAFDGFFHHGHHEDAEDASGAVFLP